MQKRKDIVVRIIFAISVIFLCGGYYFIKNPSLSLGLSLLATFGIMFFIYNANMDRKTKILFATVYILLFIIRIRSYFMRY